MNIYQNFEYRIENNNIKQNYEKENPLNKIKFENKTGIRKISFPKTKKYSGSPKKQKLIINRTDLNNEKKNKKEEILNFSFGKKERKNIIAEINVKDSVDRNTIHNNKIIKNNINISRNNKSYNGQYKESKIRYIPNPNF